MCEIVKFPRRYRYSSQTMFKSQRAAEIIILPVIRIERCTPAIVEMSSCGMDKFYAAFLAELEQPRGRDK